VRILLQSRPWLLAVIGYALIVAALTIVAANVAVWLWPKQYANAVDLAVAAALAAVAGVLLSIQWKLQERQVEQSAFFLDRSLAGWDRGWAILNDSMKGAPEERRTRWIAAARVIERARRLTERVTDSAHRDVLEIELTHQRQRFHPFFEQPGPFYYGVDQHAIASAASGSLMDEAARRSTEGTGSTASTR
jgi:hypothetical protein